MKPSDHFRSSSTFGRKPKVAASISDDSIDAREIDALPFSHHAGQKAESIFRFSDRYFELRKLALKSLFTVIGEGDHDRHSRSELQNLVEMQITTAIDTLKLDVATQDLRVLAQDLVHDLIGLGPLEDLLAQDDITDIMVVGPKSVYFERRGTIVPAHIEFQDEVHLRSISQRIARRIGRRIDESSPMVDARLPDGSRVNIVMAPLAIDGTILTIRKFQRDRLNFSALIEMNALDRESVALLHWLVQIRCNILVVGGTGSGKTTLLNCLNQILSRKERIVTCEDAAELRLQQPHVVRLETRSNNLEGTGEIPMRALIRNSLRMRPDRIIVGEIRGEEAFDFIQAMNTGHDGSMGTMHANSASDALSRLEGLISLGAPSLPSRTIQSMIHSAVDVIIEVRRYRDGRRRVSQIIEIQDWTESGIQCRSILEFVESEQSTRENIDGRFLHHGIQAHRILQKADHMGLPHDLETTERDYD